MVTCYTKTTVLNQIEMSVQGILIAFLAHQMSFSVKICINRDRRRLSIMIVLFPNI